MHGRVRRNSISPSVLTTSGAPWPALQKSIWPVTVSIIPNQHVTNMLSSLLRQMSVFTLLRTSSGLDPGRAHSSRSAFVTAMNIAAGTPLPETSATTTAR